MSFKEDVKIRVDIFFGDVVIGVILGKNLGDYIAYKLTTAYGTEAGLLLGIAIAVILHFFWIPLEKWFERKYE